MFENCDKCKWYFIGKCKGTTMKNCYNPNAWYEFEESKYTCKDCTHTEPGHPGRRYCDDCREKRRKIATAKCKKAAQVKKEAKKHSDGQFTQCLDGKWVTVTYKDGKRIKKVKLLENF